jgi:hypothetical protein
MKIPRCIKPPNIIRKVNIWEIVPMGCPIGWRPKNVEKALIRWSENP